MSENDNLEKLLRLKKYETPGEEYFDNFLDEMKERQRQDALKQSTFGLLKDRAADWYEELGSAKWAVPAGSFAAIMLTFFAFNGKEVEPAASVNENQNNDIKNQVFELKLPKVPIDDTYRGSTSGTGLVPAGFGGYREL